MGALGKIILSVGLAVDALAGNISIVLAGAGSVGLIFAILFIEFLLTAQKYRLEKRG